MKMAEIKTIYKGESVTLLFTFHEAYNMARLASHKVFVGETEFTGVIDGRTIKLQLKSSDTNRMIGTHRIVCLIDDTTLGLRKPYCGELVIAKTQASGSTTSVSNISDIIIPIVISETAITVGDVLYNYVKGDKGDPFLYSDFTPEQIAELQQPATDAIVSIEAVELAVEQAEALRVTAEQDRQTNTATAIQNAETATTGANDAASLANEKAGLANNAATLANEKAGLAAAAATQANDARDGANSAAQSATNLVNSYATDLAAKELKANKQNSLAADGTGTKFPTVDAVNEGLANSGIRALFIARGATYNATTGFYSLNGLTDITEGQMMDIYNYTSQSILNNDLTESFTTRTIRTTYNPPTQASVIMNSSFSLSKLEVLKTGSYVTSARYCFNTCSFLKTVDYLFLSGTTDSVYFMMFYMCTSLVTCFLRSINVNISLQWSPLISLESLQYIIQYRGNGTKQITITVHPTVFAKLTDNTNFPAWYAVNQDALTKYITFASA
jgi:hypothetical protein